MLNRRAMLKFALAGYSAITTPDRMLSAQRQGSGPLLVHSREPHNAEPHLDQLVKSWITPSELLYVRSHAPVPQIDPGQFRLSVEGLVEKPFQLTVAQMRSEFAKHSIVATMTCAGNRRNEHSLVKPVGGVPWQAGAIGNASWSGAKLSDLLQKAVVRAGAKHILFEGVDQIERANGVIPFGASIPLAKAMANWGPMPGALVTYEMNDQPLSPDHGFPLRTVVPGYIGARSVKWLGRIIVSDQPSMNHYVSKAYRLVTEDTPAAWSSAEPLSVFPMNSATCIPAALSQHVVGQLTVRGYALAAGMAGRVISQVELSTDGGRRWQTANLTSPAQPYCWRLWESQVRIAQDTTEIVVRATDSAGGRQPETVAWNLKGYLFNGWHRTQVVARDPATGAS